MVTLPSARRIATPIELAFAWYFGVCASNATTLEAMYRGGALRMPRIRAYKIRSAMNSEAIDTTSEGYILTDVGRAECKRAIKDFISWAVGEAA